MPDQVPPDVSRVMPKLSGNIPPERIGKVDFQRPRKEVVDGFKEIQDIVPAVSDVLDRRGIIGVIPNSELPPLLPEATIVGPAVTVRHEAERFTWTQGLMNKQKSKLGGSDACAICQPGDVMVIDGKGLAISFMGDLGAARAKRSGFVGSIVDGGVRDASGVIASGLPVWARHITPLTGQLRMEAVELNGIVTIRGVRIEPGDIIIADRTGIAVVPRDLAEQILRDVQTVVAEEKRSGSDAILRVPLEGERG